MIVKFWKVVFVEHFPLANTTANLHVEISEFTRTFNLFQ